MGFAFLSEGKLAVYLLQIVTEPGAFLFQRFGINTGGRGQLIDVFDGTISGLLGLPENALGFLIGRTDNLVPTLVKALFLFLQTGFQAGNLGLIALNFLPLLFDGNPAFLQMTDNILKGFVLCFQVCFASSII